MRHVALVAIVAIRPLSAVPLDDGTLFHNVDTKMSRRNNIRGPTSALTEFLRESGITPTTIARRTRTRQVEQPVASSSTTTQDDEVVTRNGQGEADEYNSDKLDESDEEPAPKKRKLSKAAEAKLKAKEKAKAKAKAKGKKKGDDSDYEDDSEEDPYTALSKMWKGNSPSKKPAVGSFADCARCEKQFTVTKYTMAAVPPPGFLCHLCVKASGTDPFKKPATPRKRKPAGEKRSVVHFEERRFPSLSMICIEIITKHIDDVEALGNISNINMDQLAKSLSRNRSLTQENALLFYNAGNTTLTIYDATNLFPPALCTMAALNPSLTTLRLDFCGRINDEVINTWSTSLPNLRRVELLGPFLVNPSAWQAFFEAHNILEGFLITQSPRFSLECVNSLVENCPHLTELRLKEIGLMDDSFLEPIKELGQESELHYLDLSYPGNPELLTEEACIKLLEAVGENLTHLDFSGLRSLSDGFLFQGIKPHAKRLTCLILTNVPELTDAGVAEFFNTWELEKNTSPLSNLEFARNHEIGTNALVALLKRHGKDLTHLNINSWRTASGEALKGIGSRCPKLRKLDMSWCREVDNWVVEELMEHCGHLEEVKVWGCQRINVDCPKKRGVNVIGVEVSTV